MKLFTDLYVRLDQTNKTNEKIEAMREYFAEAPPEDSAWALYFLSGRKPRQIVPSKLLRQWSLELSGIPEWLYMESRDTVGDGAETMALLLPNANTIDETPLHTLVEDQLLPLRGLGEAAQKEAVTSAWSRMNYSQRLVYNQQADIGSLSCRRLAASGHAGTLAAFRDRTRHDRSSANGRMGTKCGVFHKTSRPSA